MPEQLPGSIAASVPQRGPGEGVEWRFVTLEDGRRVRETLPSCNPSVWTLNQYLEQPEDQLWRLRHKPLPEGECE